MKNRNPGFRERWLVYGERTEWDNSGNRTKGEPVPRNGLAFSNKAIQNLIYVVRGQQVMMDSDLAALYQVETKVFNQAVKRNIARFPDAFCFQITDQEYEGFEVTDCYLKRKGRKKISSICFYGAGYCNAFSGIE